MERRILLLRHGRTKGNLERRYVGSTDEGLLEEEVRLLSGNAGASFRTASGFRPRVVYVSPMKRAVQTAGLLFPDAELTAVPDFRECSFGAFEYRNYEELKEEPAYQAYLSSGGETAFPGGESRSEYEKRVVRAFRDISRGDGAEELVIAAHGGTIMAILDAFSDPHRPYFDWQAGNVEGYLGIFDGRCIRDLQKTGITPEIRGKYEK